MKCRWCGKEITKAESDKYEGHCGEYHMESNWRIESICVPMKKVEVKDKVTKILKRKIEDKVFINPYYNTTGTIIDTKEDTKDNYFDKKYDYKMKWNQKMADGTGEWQYYNEDELDFLQKNWDMVKRG